VKRQRPRPGDVFLVRVGSEHVAIGQVLELIPRALNSIGIAVWEPLEVRDHQRSIASEPPLAVLLSTPELLKRGVWVIEENIDPVIPIERRPYERFRSADWIGADIHGAGIVRQLLDACVGLTPWDDWADRSYLDGLLYPGRARPHGAVLLNAS
jgi:hypothetical protein